MSPGLSLAHYRITAKLGEGGMGEVWRATDTKLDREVAIKILPEALAADPDRMARFEREAKVLASLNHPNIAAIHGVEERALVMELVDGPTLAERIAGGAIPLEETLPIARQIAEALEYAHEKGVVHRDLKPANIKITPQGRVKVLDFGLAKALANEPAAGDPAMSPTLTMRATMAGVIMGTAAYMAPEQARGQNVDKRADIWAFGVLLYEMVTGRQLFGGPTVSDTLAAVLRQEPDWTAVPPRLRKLLKLCLAREPRERLREIGDAPFLMDEPEATPAASEAPVARSGVRWWMAGAAVLAAALATVSVIHFRETPPEPAAVRFQIPPPEGGTFATPYFALSPDGRKLAFTANAKNGSPMLWVRALDTLEARALPGTEEALYPFWSPDSRFVAFTAVEKLKKVDASGGPPQTLCNLPSTMLGGFWSQEGAIYFGNTASGIFRVPQAGGDPVAVTRVDAAHGEASHRNPVILPDGRRVLYNISFSETEKDAIFLSPLDGKEKKRVAGSSRAFAYVPPQEEGKPAHLLFLREETLMAQPLDAKTLDPAGDAFPVAEHVGSGRSYSFFSVSRDGVLAYRTGSAASATRVLTWFDRKGQPVGTLGPPGPYLNVSLSRDGTRAAVVQATPQSRGLDIWLIEVARQIPTRFTFGEAEVMDPVWSPDGSRVAFSSRRAGPSTLYIKDSSGGAKEEQVQKAEADERPCDWSPDGRFLLFTRLNPTTRLPSLWVLSDPTDPAKRKAAPYLDVSFSMTQGQFSPDGRWVAYTSNESKPRTEIYVQSFPADGRKFQVSSDGGTQPRWRGDGKEIFYIAHDGKLMAADVKTAPRFEAVTPHALFDSQVPVNISTLVVRYAVAFDGQRFLVNTQRQQQTPGAPDAITVVLNWMAGVKK
jgi:Tol biopolymer transport system component